MTETLHPEESVTTFLLIRHGHTQATEEGRLYTDPDAPLTERGIKQAQALANWLPSQKPDVLLTSPAKRVMTTSEIVSSSLSMKPVVIEGLTEWHIGDWEGRTYLDLKKSEPDMYKAWSSDPIHNAPPGGESIAQLCKRIKGEIAEIRANHEGKRVVVVTHAGVIRAAIVQALAVPVENFWRLSIPVGSASKLDLSSSFATLQYMAFRPDGMGAIGNPVA